MSFSFKTRRALLENFATEKYDVIIIGGGITGAGIALDAASRGLKTALIEKDDFAYGTSSRSTKLIHGGLRYLKQLEFGLVKEVGSERAIVHRLAPHLVIPEKMLLPLYEKKGLGYWLTSIGLMIYDYLAAVRREDQRRMLTRGQTLRHEPLLKNADVRGGAIYAEYRTDDARLTIEIVKTAFRLGADIVNYVRAEEFIYEQGKIKGVIARDLRNDEVISLNGQVVVSATGPWVDELREINRSKTGKRLRLTKGVHIVVPREKFPVSQAIYFDVDDGRMVFAIPRGRTTYIGTTDTNYEGSPDDVITTRQDAEYLLKAVNATFPTINLRIKDIESTWAGLRPLIHEEGKSASQLSRKDEIFESESGLISIAGGKLTGYRRMADRVINLVMKRHFAARPMVKCTTHKIPLTGSDFHNNREVRKYILRLNRALKIYNISDITISYLVSTYGKQTDSIIEHFKKLHDLDTEFRLLKAELIFTVEFEMTVTLLDFFIRRTGLGYFHIRKVVQFKDEISSVMQQLTGLSDAEADRQKKELEKYINQITSFK